MEWTAQLDKIAKIGDLIIDIRQRSLYISKKFEKTRVKPNEKDEASFTESKLVIETKSSSVRILTVKDWINEKSNTAQL